MNKVYARINWENYPSENTPLNESNLNKIDYGLNEVDNRVIELDTTKVSSSALSDNIKSWSMDEATGIITIEKYSGEKVLFDLNIEKIPVSFSLSDDGILTMTTDDGTQFKADIGSMIPVLTFNDSETIAVSVTGTGVNKTYSFSIKTGSVTGDMLEDNYLANINVKVSEAEGYANTSSTNATESGNSATLSESWAVGGTGIRDGENTNNAKYYAEQAAAVSNVEIATTEKAGLVKPDGNTITVQEDGTISAVGGTAEKVTATDSHEFGFSNVQGFIDIASEKLVNNEESLSSLNTDLTQLSNPNLLINPDFKINQRGVTSFTSANYGVDRWKALNKDAEVTGDGIKLNSGTPSALIEQYVETGIEDGDIVTFSVFANDKIYKCTGTVTYPQDESVITVASSYVGDVYIDVITDNSYLRVRIFMPNSDEGNSIIVKWAKLEVGSIATPFVSPNPATELLKCQRYYEKGFGYYNGVVARVGDTAVSNIEFKVTKRTIPTISLTLAEGNYGGIDLDKGLSYIFTNTKNVQAAATSTILNPYFGYMFVADAEIH